MKQYQELGLEKGCKEPGWTHDSPMECDSSISWNNFPFITYKNVIKTHAVGVDLNYLITELFFHCHWVCV